MKSILKFPSEDLFGNLFWMIPYIYPLLELDDGIDSLRKKGYLLDLLPEGDGISFKSKIENKDKVLLDFKAAFPWMKISLSSVYEEMDLEGEIFDEQIVILPLSRFEILESIHTVEYSIFPKAAFEIDRIRTTTIDEILSKNSEVKTIREHLNELTNIDKTIFKENPLIVMRGVITIQKYLKLKHFDDNELIIEFSNRAEDLFDIIRFEYCNYTVPELLPSRAGLYNDRNSTALIYFPKYQFGFFQSREVELKNFIKGIGLKIDYVDRIQYHPLLVFEQNETGRITKHALRLNSLIQESDNETMKFIQIMGLMEFIGNPFGFEKFQDLKKKLIAIIAQNKTEYHNLSKRFKELTGGLTNEPARQENGLRTLLVHNGQRIEQIIPHSKDRKELFKELETYIQTNLRFMIKHCSTSWEDFDRLRNKLINKYK